MPSNRLFMTLCFLFIAWFSEFFNLITTSSLVRCDFYVSHAKLIYFKNVSFWHVDWKCKKGISKSRRQSGHMDAIVESVVRRMNGSNCKTDWAWDIVRYITWTFFFPRPLLHSTTIHQSHSWSNLCLLRRQIYVNWRLVKRGRKRWFDYRFCLEHKLYLWLSCSASYDELLLITVVVSMHVYHISKSFHLTFSPLSYQASPPQSKK